MNRLCDDVLQHIFIGLDEPADFAECSKRMYSLSQDPYVRASYFLLRYGQSHAMFWALGKGRVLKPRVVDILLESGAHLSRYLAQVAVHHYFRAQSQIVKGSWVRSLAFPDFSYFMLKAGEMYGNIPAGKGEDDGSVFSTFLKESKYPKDLRSVNWEDIRDILEKYKFMPFAPKDPLMVQFPLALSVEPRLLPYAIANGFTMDMKYRDFIFRRMFEKRNAETTSHADEIVQNTRELSRLDPSMFVSRTVAAEVCMEAKTNESAYEALKRLDKGGYLLFDLATIVNDLVKLFARTRTVTSANIATICRTLNADFPSTDPAVRTVLLLTVLNSEKMKQYGSLPHPMATLREALAELKLGPLTREDIANVLSDPFAERPGRLLEYAREEMGLSEDEVSVLAKEAALRSMEESSKGKTIRHLVESYKSLKEAIAEHVVANYQLTPEDLPSSDNEQACRDFYAKLSRDMALSVSSAFKMSYGSTGSLAPTVPQHDADDTLVGEGLSVSDGDVSMESVGPVHGRKDGGASVYDLGSISQSTLTSMIRKDEMSSRPARRSWFGHYYTAEPFESKYTYPSNALEVGRWVYQTYHHESAIVAVFMTHAIVNCNDSLVQHFLGSHPSQAKPVPVTLKHFKLLARLGKAPCADLWAAIAGGAEFYFSEDDYVPTKEEDSWGSPPGLLVDTKQGNVNELEARGSVQVGVKRKASDIGYAQVSSVRTKRPRRSAANQAKSYAESDLSSEERIELDSETEAIKSITTAVKETKKATESNLQLWIKHLKILQKKEQAKYNVKRRQTEKMPDGVSKLRIPKSEFFKVLSTKLRDLQHIEARRRVTALHVASEDSPSEGEDAEYRLSPRSKRRILS